MNIDVWSSVVLRIGKFGRFQRYAAVNLQPSQALSRILLGLPWMIVNKGKLAKKIALVKHSASLVPQSRHVLMARARIGESMLRIVPILFLLLLPFGNISCSQPECIAGPCCRDNSYRPSGTICAEGFEYRCLEQCGGANREYRMYITSCSGTSNDCDRSETEITGWSPMEDCPSDHACKLEYIDEEPECVPCQDDGKICVAGVCKDR